MSRLFELLLKVAEKNNGDSIVHLRLFDDASGSVYSETGWSKSEDIVEDFKGEDDLIAKLQHALGKDSK